MSVLALAILSSWSVGRGGRQSKALFEQIDTVDAA